MVSEDDAIDYLIGLVLHERELESGGRMGE